MVKNMIFKFWEIRNWIWPYFKPAELACPCCGDIFIDFELLEKLVAARAQVGKPFIINSGHRCGLHNARVGGVPLSQHKKLAVDISFNNHDKIKLRLSLEAAGFSSFGIYKNFIHIDNRKNRFWQG